MVVYYIVARNGYSAVVRILLKGETGFIWTRLDPSCGMPEATEWKTKQNIVLIDLKSADERETEGEEFMVVGLLLNE